MTFFEKSVLDKSGCLYYLLPPQRDFDISPNSIYQQQELHVLVTVSLFMDLTITYKYQSLISNDINILCCVRFYFVALDVSLAFHFLLCLCYVNPAYGCQMEINCIYLWSLSCKAFLSQNRQCLPYVRGKAGAR